MAINVAIMGDAGSGKSTSIRTLPSEKTFIIKVFNKPFPFKPKGFSYFDGKEGNVILTDSPEEIADALTYASNAGYEHVVIDDAQYIMAHAYMRKSEAKGVSIYDVMRRIQVSFWNLIMHSMNLSNPSLIVYWLIHKETADNGSVKIKTLGKLLDEKISIDGMFTVLLEAFISNEKKHLFKTISDGASTAKSPIGMFDEETIPNDLSFVADRVKNFFLI